MADLESSSPLARRLSTAQFFAFGRRLVRAADQCVIDQGGIVGRHAGDGTVAFFLEETGGSESAAARSCIAASRALRAALGGVAVRSEVPETDVSLRFGLHWVGTLYVGRILAEVQNRPLYVVREEYRGGGDKTVAESKTKKAESVPARSDVVSSSAT